MVETIDLAILAGIAAVGALIAWVAYILSRRAPPQDPASLETALVASMARSSDILKGAFATSMRELGLDKEIGSIRTTATEILKSSRQLQTLFEVKRGRAQFAEFQLEEILKDILPPGKVGIREHVQGFGMPDAHIETSEGILCIDAKFPLENYRRMLEAEGDEKRKHASAFRRDVERHIEKVAHDYVRPEEGGLPFALIYIPSEAVYQYLSEAEGELLAEASRQGVTLVSPSTLVVTLNVLGTAIRAQEIAEKAEEIESRLKTLNRLFEGFEEHWHTLRKHLSNAYERAADADKAYFRLREGYNRISRLESEKEGGD